MLLTGAFRLLLGCAAIALVISVCAVMFQANKLTVMVQFSTLKTVLFWYTLL